MNFEKGLDPKIALDVGLKSRAPTVHRLYHLEEKDGYYGKGFYKKSNPEVIHKILKSVIECPVKGIGILIEFIEEGNPKALLNFTNTYVKYEGQYYLIPNYEL